MSEPLSALQLFPLVAEGAVDRVCGRPRSANPYCVQAAPDWATAWECGWDAANEHCGVRVQEEARRWLEAA